jgi:murein DD-endopeptidase MepM/ murein hydrolase activator NlpD
MNLSIRPFCKVKRMLPAALLSLSLGLTACFPDNHPEEPATASEQSQPVEGITQASIIDYSPPTDSYGIQLNAYDIESHVIRRGQTLSTMLSPYGADHSIVHKISQAARGVFNLRSIKSGNDVSYYLHPESGELHYFIYQPSEREYVVFDIRNPEDIRIEKGRREVEVALRRIESNIESSLYMSLQNAGANPLLVHRLSDVYAWQVDFYRIMPGDHFAVIYEEQLIDGEPVGIGKIETALFHHRGEDYHAIYFEKEPDIGNYYDTEGNSLQKQFLRAPLEYSRISSRFTNRRYHPVLGRNMPHHGTDYAAPRGTPIRAVGDGTIIHSAYDRNNGNYIRIRHNGVYETGYLHMSRRASGMQTGTTVQQGQIIGYVGSTGLATGPHLCFRFWRNKRPVDPYQVEIPPSEPIEDQYLRDFFEVRDQKLEMLFPGENNIDNPDEMPITTQESIWMNEEG